MHADAAKEAVKPKKGKKKDADENSCDENRAHPAEKKRRKKAVSDADDDSADSYDEDEEVAGFGSTTKGVSSRPQRNVVSSSSFYSNGTSSTFDSGMWCKIYADSELGIKQQEVDGDSVLNSKIFKVCTMSEWPGQNEGKAFSL